jgi:hypothetical protein
LFLLPLKYSLLFLFVHYLALNLTLQTDDLSLIILTLCIDLLFLSNLFLNLGVKLLLLLNQILLFLSQMSQFFGLLQ